MAEGVLQRTECLRKRKEQNQGEGVGGLGSQGWDRGPWRGVRMLRGPRVAQDA